jgi:hypothetical protein
LRHRQAGNAARQDFRVPQPEFVAVTTFGYEPSGITAFALATLVLRRELTMPIGRYIACVGTSLLALIFLADWFFPKSLPEPTPDAITKPVIRIASVQQPPERIVIDTSQPTVIPPAPAAQDAIASKPLPLQSYAAVAPRATIADVDQRKRKPAKRQVPKLASDRPPSASNPALTSRSPATTVPSTRLSFVDFISKVRRNLFNLN